MSLALRLAVLSICVIAAVGAADRAAQDALLADLEAAADEVSVKRDEAGDIVRLKIVNRRPEDGTPVGKPGIDDELAQRIAGCSGLRSLHIEMQPLTDAGYAVVAELPALEHVQFHYVDMYPDRQPSADFAAPLAGCRALKSLAIHHNFNLGHVDLAPLAEGFPQLRMLSLDTGAAGPHALPLIVNSPEIELLALNRSSMADADIAAIVDVLPGLRFLKLRASGDGLTPACIASIAECRELRYLHLGGIVPDAAAVDRLAAMPELAMLRFELSHERIAETLAALRAAAPELDVAAGGEDAYWRRGSLARDLARAAGVPPPPP